MNKIYFCFPGGKHKAVTFSYDDGKLQDRRLVALFNKYGVKGTFNLNSGLWDGDEKRIKPSEIQELYRGHEVASHTVTHPTIERCPLSEVAEEVLEDRRALEKWTGYPVRGLAYPNGSLTDDIVSLLPHLGIRYARVVGSSDSFGAPRDAWRWQATCHHNHRLLENAEAFAALFKKQYLYLFYVWGHSYEFDDKNNWDMMEEGVKRVAGRDDTWYCTNIEYWDAMDDLKRLRFAADNSFVFNPNAADCHIRVNDSEEAVRIPGGETVILK